VERYCGTKAAEAAGESPNTDIFYSAARVPGPGESAQPGGSHEQEVSTGG
jgi:hypothetical protein